jgi:LDH2 family malate/lactate/ureidoglycolate dehydrogenase
MPLEQFTTRMEQLCREITETERAPGVDRIVLPGELEHERRQERLEMGIPVQDNAPAVLQEFCHGLDLEAPRLG